MKKIWIYGASDDLIEIEGDIEDEFNVESGVGTLLLYSPANNESVAVEVRYQKSGTWSVAPYSLDEDHQLPSWYMRIKQSTSCKYSTGLGITAPDDLTITFVSDKEE